MTCSNSSMRCNNHHRHGPTVQLLRGSAVATTVLLLAWILFLTSTPATMRQLPWQIPPEPGLGTPATLPLLAHSLLPPAARDFRLSLPDGLDAEWPLRWTWQGFSWRGLTWQTTLTVWPHALENNQGDLLTYLPTRETISFPGLAAALPAVATLPVWTPPTAPIGTSAHSSQIQHRLAAGLLALAAVAIAAALLLLSITWLDDAPRRNALKHLSDSRHPLAADAIQTVVVAYFAARRRPPRGRDLLRLADSLARGSNREALLAPSLRCLTHWLNHIRFSQRQPPPEERLASCQRLARFIIRYDR